MGKQVQSADRTTLLSLLVQRSTDLSKSAGLRFQGQNRCFGTPQQMLNLIALGITDKKSRCTDRCSDEIHLRLQFSINRGLAMALRSSHHPLEGLRSPSAKQKPPVQSALIKNRLLNWD